MMACRRFAQGFAVTAFQLAQLTRAKNNRTVLEPRDRPAHPSPSPSLSLVSGGYRLRLRGHLANTGNRGVRRRVRQGLERNLRITIRRIHPVDAGGARIHRSRSVHHSCVGTPLGNPNTRSGHLERHRRRLRPPLDRSLDA